MKRLLLLSLVLLPWLCGQAYAQSAAEDSIDVNQYILDLHFQPDSTCQFVGHATLSFVLTRPCQEVSFDLICDSINPASLTLDGQPATGTYDRSNVRLTIALPNNTQGPHQLGVTYYTNGHVESYGWGGLHISRSMCYNLGVAFDDYPHNYGRAWFPCRDNFYDKASYQITLTTPAQYLHQCSGNKLRSTTLDGLHTTEWQLTHPTPTYLVSISIAPFHIIEREYQGLYGTYPATLGFTDHDSTRVYAAYDILQDVVPMYERCFGPYQWDRIGYVATPKGSMEHVNNIGLVSSCMASDANACQMVICHELAHAWFGNLITCATAEDMWFNEGGASFCEEIATEAAFGKEAANDYYQDMFSGVLRTAHVNDNGYRSLSGMSQYYTYGSTTYKQGAMMWHSLRGYLGDSLFYQCMQRLFRNSFTTISAEQLRDTLTLYSGLDLTGFFDFHVFHPGFVDYSLDCLQVEGNRATVTLRQQLTGTDRYARANRVPITFFSADRQTSDQLMLFDDSVATQSFDLPFQAAYAVVDYRLALSDACTSDTLKLQAKGLKDLSHAFCKVYLSQPDNNPQAWLHIGHHYAHPEGELADGILRLANRYWQVSGLISWDNIPQGRFLYNQGTNNTTGASFIDYGFYDNRATLDSLALVYRADATQPWRLVSRSRTSSSTASTGYFTANLFPGQYALAVVDTALVSIATPTLQQSPLRIIPNPSSGRQFRVDWGESKEKCTLTIYDTTSRKVLEKRGVTSGSTISHNLPSGTYFVLIQNNYVSLQSQIIIQ